MERESRPCLVILAAGLGSRYGGLKQLDSVGPNGETIIDYSIYDAIKAGFGKVISVIRRSFADEYRAKITDKFKSKVEFVEVYQPTNIRRDDLDTVERLKPWGTGHAVLCTREQVGEPFAVINADDYYGRQAMNKMAEFLKKEVAPDRFCMVGFVLKNTLSPHGPVSRGVCVVDRESNLVEVREHKGVEATDDGNVIAKYRGEDRVLDPEVLVSMNMWGFHPGFYNYLEARFERFIKKHSQEQRAEFYLPTPVNELVQDGRVRVSVLPSEERWYGVTYKEDRQEVISALHEKVEAGIYPSPIWSDD